MSKKKLTTNLVFFFINKQKNLPATSELGKRVVNKTYLSSIYKNILKHLRHCRITL